MFNAVHLFPSDPSDKAQVDRLQGLSDMVDSLIPPEPIQAAKIPLSELLAPIELQLRALVDGEIDYVAVHYGMMLQHLRALCYMVHGSLETSQQVLEYALPDMDLVSIDDIQDVEHRRRYKLVIEATKKSVKDCVASRNLIANLAADLDRELAAAADAKAADQAPSDKGPGPAAGGGSSLAIVEIKGRSGVEQAATHYKETPRPHPSAEVVQRELDFFALFPPTISRCIVPRSAIDIVRLPIFQLAPPTSAC